MTLFGFGKGSRDVDAPLTSPPPRGPMALRLVRVEPYSVTRLAFVVSVALMIVTTVAVAIFWLMLAVTGVWGEINQAVASLSSDAAASFDITDYLAEALRELRKHNFTETPDRFFGFGSHLLTRDRKAVRKTFSGLMKVMYPDGEASPDEMAELLGQICPEQPWAGNRAGIDAGLVESGEGPRQGRRGRRSRLRRHVRR